jgi:hypothetical protein
MQSDGVIAQITISEFFNQIGGKIEDVIAKNQNSHEVKYIKRIGKDD